MTFGAWLFVILLCSMPLLILAGIGYLIYLSILDYRDYTTKSCSIVSCQGSGGDYNFDKMSNLELMSFLKLSYNIYKNADIMHNGHTAEFRGMRRNHVSTIGYIDNEKVVLKGRTYYFPDED